MHTDAVAGGGGVHILRRRRAGVDGWGEVWSEPTHAQSDGAAGSMDRRVQQMM